MLLAVAVAGWFDGPVIGRHGLIGADQVMSIGHAIMGVLLLMASFSGESTCAFALYAAGTASVLFAAYGLYELGAYDSIHLGPGASCYVPVSISISLSASPCCCSEN